MGVATTLEDTTVAIRKAYQEYDSDCCKLRSQHVRRREIMNPVYVTLSTSKQATQAYSCKVFERWDMGLKPGFTNISLVDQSKLWPSSQFEHLELGD